MIGRRTRGLLDASADYRGPAVRCCSCCRAGELHSEDRHAWEIEPHSHQWRHGVDGDPWCSRCGTDRLGGPCVR